MRMKKRAGRKASWLLIALAILVSASCNFFQGQGSKANSTAIIVLIDRSASTDQDRALYKRAVDDVLNKLKPGDRLVAAWITESSASDFRNYLDESLPPPLPPMRIWDVPAKYNRTKQAWEQQDKTETEKMRDGMARLLSFPSASPETGIFESLRIAGQIFASEPRPHKVLIVLSDMVEDSREAHFDKMRLDDTAIAKEIALQQREHVMPNLRGVHVYVAGALGEPMQRSADVERFWKRYFHQAGAQLDPGDYSRAVPNFTF